MIYVYLFFGQIGRGRQSTHSKLIAQTRRMKLLLNASLKVFLEPAGWHVMLGQRRPGMTCQAAGSRKTFNEAFKRSFSFKVSPRTATYVYIYAVKSDVNIHVYIYLGIWAGLGSRIN